MNAKKLTGIACIIVGAILLFFSNYIAEQVTAGKQRIASGQQQVDTYNKYFSATPYSKELGKQVTAPYQRRINEGNVEVSYYESLSLMLQIFGIILILIGIAILVFWKKKS